jgi:hypothetical protein
MVDAPSWLGSGFSPLGQQLSQTQTNPLSHLSNFRARTTSIRARSFFKVGLNACRLKDFQFLCPEL